MVRRSVALTGHRLEQYGEIHDWLSDLQRPGDPELTAQVVIELAFDELLKRKQQGERIEITFTDDHIEHAWREKGKEGTAITVSRVAGQIT